MKRLTPERKLEWSWILYDVGNSAFTLLISTIMPIYFNGLAEADGIAKEVATAYWGYAASIVTLCVAVLSPIFGTLSDFKGYKRPVFMLFAIMGVLGCAALGIPMPWLIFLIVFILTKIFYSGSLAFYDAMLVDMTTPKRADIVSSKGYAFGYIGSCIPFGVCLVLVLAYESIGISMEAAMVIAFFIITLWWLLGAVPLLRSYRQIHYVEAQHEPVRRFYIFKAEYIKRKMRFIYTQAQKTCGVSRGENPLGSGFRSGRAASLLAHGFPS